MSKFEIVSELIDTVICGNSIKGNETYEKMLARVTVKDIRNYLNEFGYTIPSVEFVGYSDGSVGVFKYSDNPKIISEKITKLVLFGEIKKAF